MSRRISRIDLTLRLAVAACAAAQLAIIAICGAYLIGQP